MMERIEILGQSGHSSDPNLGRSALEAMHATIGELMALRGNGSGPGTTRSSACPSRP